MFSAQEISFPLTIYLGNVNNFQFPVDLLAFTQKILNGKLYFFSAVYFFPKYSRFFKEHKDL